MIEKQIEKSETLAKIEKKQVGVRVEEISGIVQKIEDILIESNCNWNEWHNIVAMFNERSEVVIPQITIKEIKQRYEQLR